MVPPIYGPVPSRRLGFSLGLDILPFKTCTFDCIYCQLGRTARKTNRRKSFVQEAEIIPSLTKLLPSIPEPDCLTFSGLGEPTLNSAIGPLIRRLKKITALPIVVLTNSSLLSRKQVRRDLCMADIIV
ncbi:MAG: radical SAM protein, partial [Candidatus Aminicenantales bacterium]